MRFLLSRDLGADQVLPGSLDGWLLKQYAVRCLEASFNRDAVAGGDQVLGLVVVHLVQKPKVLLSDRQKAAPDLDQFATTQLF